MNGVQDRKNIDVLGNSKKVFQVFMIQLIAANGGIKFTASPEPVFPSVMPVVAFPVFPDTAVPAAAPAVLVDDATSAV